MDPHLWSELDGPAGDEVAALVRLVPGAPPPPGVCVVARFCDIATIRLARGDLLAVRADPCVVSLKAATNVRPEPAAAAVERGRERVRHAPAVRRSLGPGAPTGRGTVIGVVDWGCDFTHPNLLRASGRTRLLALWDQRPRRGHAPRPYGYGVVHRAAHIDRALEARDPFAALGYDPVDFDADGAGTHGMHVIDIAAGSPQFGPGGVAPGADLVFVHLANPPAGPRGIGSSVSLVEAAHFIAQTAGARPWVINLSLGSHGGPHDGSTLVEQALDAAVTERAERTIVQSCGNYGLRPIHAQGRLRAGERVTIDWRVDPTDDTENEIEVWYPGSDALAVELIAPNGKRVLHAPPDSHGPIVYGGRTVGRFGHRTHDPNNGDHHASLRMDPLGGGDWRVVLHALTIVSGEYHAWVERDELRPGSQSRLSRVQAVHTTTTGTISNGRHTIAVGAYDPAQRGAASFSSRGPTRDGRAKPDVLARGVDVLAARSAPDDDDGDPYLTRKSGTSMAAPHVTGAVALLYEAAGRALRCEEVKRILVETAQRVAGNGGPGLLDVRAALARVRPAQAVGLLGEDDVPVVARADLQLDFKCPSGDAPPPPPAPVAVAPPRRLPPPDFVRPDDPALDRGVRLQLATSQNLHFWKLLALEPVRPLRDLVPSAQPKAFANRTIAFQRFLRAGDADQAVIGRRIDVDGILGLYTLQALWRIARRPQHAGLRTETSALGFDLDALLDPAGRKSASMAEALATPFTVITSAPVKAGAARVVDLFRAIPENESEDLERLDRYLFGSTKPPLPNVTFEDRLKLLAVLLKGLTLTGRSTFITLPRAFFHRIDADMLLKPRRAPSGVWWVFARKKAGEAGDKNRGSDLAATTLGLDFAANERARSALATMDEQGLSVPRIFHFLTFDYPALSEADRQAAVGVWMAAKVDAERKTGAIAASNIYQVLSNRNKDYHYLTWDRELETELVTFRVVAPIFFEYCLDALHKEYGAVTFEELFGAVAGIKDYDRRDLLAELTLRTRYATDPIVVRFVDAHRRNTESMRTHAYDATARVIRLEKSADRVLYTKGVDPNKCIADDVFPGYRQDLSYQRIKPARMEALCLQTMKEVAQRLDQLATGSGAADVDSAALAREAVEAASKSMSPPLSNGDFESGAYRISIRVYDIEAVPRAGLDRYRIKYARCERFRDEPWRDIEEPSWHSEVEFTEELGFFRFCKLMEAVQFIATVAAGAVMFAGLWLGAGAALLSLAGGAAKALAGIAISEVFYLIGAAVTGKPITWEGVFDAAVEGYLWAVGFKLFTGAASRVATWRLLTPDIVRNRVRAVLIRKLVGGAGAGAFALPSSMFVKEMIGVVRVGGGLSSWDSYLKAAGLGAAMGGLFEVGGSVVLSGVFGAAKGTVLDKAVQAIGDNARKAVDHLSKQGILPARWSSEAVVSLSVFRQRMNGVLRDPAVAAAATEAMTARVKGITAAWGRFKGGVDTMIHTQALELAKVNLGRGAVEGLRRVLTNARGLPDKAVEDFMRRLVAKGPAADDVLGLLGAVGDSTFAKLSTPDALTRLVGADDVLGLVRRISPTDVAFTLAHDFEGSLNQLANWAKRFEQLPAPRQADVLDVLRAHGASFRPRGVLALAEQGVAFTAELRVGVERLVAMGDVKAVNVLLAARPRGVDAFARAAAQAPAADVPVYRAIVENAERGARLLEGAPSTDQLLAWVRASGNRAGPVDDLLRLVRKPDASGATPALEALEARGLERLLKASASSDAAAAGSRRMLSDPARARDVLRTAAQATDADLAAAVRRGGFEPPRTGTAPTPSVRPHPQTKLFEPSIEKALADPLALRKRHPELWGSARANVGRPKTDVDQAIKRLESELDGVRLTADAEKARILSTSGPQGWNANRLHVTRPIYTLMERINTLRNLRSAGPPHRALYDVEVVGIHMTTFNGVPVNPRDAFRSLRHPDTGRAPRIFDSFLYVADDANVVLGSRPYELKSAGAYNKGGVAVKSARVTDDDMVGHFKDRLDDQLATTNQLRRGAQDAQGELVLEGLDPITNAVVRLRVRPSRLDSEVLTAYDGANTVKVSVGGEAGEVLTKVSETAADRVIAHHVVLDHAVALRGTRGDQLVRDWYLRSLPAAQRLPPPAKGVGSGFDTLTRETAQGPVGGVHVHSRPKWTAADTKRHDVLSRMIRRTLKTPQGPIVVAELTQVIAHPETVFAQAGWIVRRLVSGDRIRFHLYSRTRGDATWSWNEVAARRAEGLTERELQREIEEFARGVSTPPHGRPAP